MIPRVIISILAGIVCVLAISLLLIGHDREQPMAPGCRKTCLRICYKITAHAQGIFGFFSLYTHKSIDADYTEYLGKPSQDDVADDKPVSTIVCNHFGFLEIMCLVCSPLHPAFTPKIAIKTTPLLNSLADGLQSMYVERGSEEGREQVMAAISERQRQIEEGSDYAPIIVFAEGTTTNGTTLLRMRKGAFARMSPIIPCFVTWSGGTIQPSFECLPFWSLIFFWMSSPLPYKVTLHIMPPFRPNAYMLEKFADKGSEPWEIYAWCMRDLIAKNGNFKISNRSLRDKFAFEDYMQRRTESVTIDNIEYSEQSPVSKGNKEPLLAQATTRESLN